LITHPTIYVWIHTDSLSDSTKILRDEIGVWTQSGGEPEVSAASAYWTPENLSSFQGFSLYRWGCGLKSLSIRRQTGEVRSFLDLKTTNAADVRQLLEDLDDAKMIKAVSDRSRKRGLGPWTLRNHPWSMILSAVFWQKCGQRRT